MLLTFVTFLVQISLTILIGYLLKQNYTPVCISLALFGLGSGAFIRLRFYRNAIPHKVFTVGFAVMGFSLLSIFLSFHTLPHILGTIVFASVFFIASGALISKFYEEFKATKAYRAYTLDLAGGAFACMAAVPLLNGAGPIVMILAAGAICLVVSLTCWCGAKKGLVYVLGSAAAVSMAALAFGVHLRVISEFPDRSSFFHTKDLTERVAAEEGSRIVDHQWSSVGRADLFESPIAVGYKWVYYDQINPSLMLTEITEQEQRDYLQKRFASFPLSILSPDDMLVIGAGGGYEVELANLGGVGSIDAVEINPAIVRLLGRWRSFTGPRYERDNVNLVIADGRTFLAETDKRYDLIQMSLVLAGTTGTSNTHALLENHLYTKESFDLVLSRLTDQGCLAIIDDSPDRSIRQLLTALAVLEDRGVDCIQAMKQVGIFYNPSPAITAYRILLLVFPKEPDTALYDRAAAEARRLNFQPLWLPGYASEQPFLDIKFYGTDAFLENQPVNLAPVSDDRPYFFDFAVNPLQQLVAVWPFLSLAVCAALASFLIRLFKSIRPSEIGTHLTAFFLGAGFIFVELGLIHKLTIAIGNPTLILSVLLFSILIWCGLGSQIGSKISPTSTRRVSIFCWTVAIVNMVFTLLLHEFYLMDSVPGGMLRILVVFVVLAPLGIVMGMPFPSLLNELKSGDDHQLASVWGVNGLASLAGANLWLVVSLMAGGTATLLFGSALYVLAGISAYRR